jgi:hypothetical protein
MSRCHYGPLSALFLHPPPRHVVIILLVAGNTLAAPNQRPLHLHVRATNVLQPSTRNKCFFPFSEAKSGVVSQFARWGLASWATRDGFCLSALAILSFSYRAQGEFTGPLGCPIYITFTPIGQIPTRVSQNDWSRTGEVRKEVSY